MGGSKRLIEENDAKYSEALHIAVEDGALQECENHNGTYFADSGDVESAQEMASEMFKNGEIEYFDDERELLKAIEAVIQQNSGDECYSCDRSDE
ncbi:hypothetical protein QPL90_04700 [Pseudomonas syringae pv. syringae]|uniref:hypothetical protein n=1 Tax=Pseudomonas syringae TaxID=317 RepID=UPI002E7AEE40|nr:hypothetical protein [Pseudomonas syringae]MEE1990807.1 hypothetical protein [Pseudomonas syringae pv. syringae]MEE1996161.1 hypothetical protein [Pseudomonas syringae pv. syringae]